jgi:hypothetical protein
MSIEVLRMSDYEYRRWVVKKGIEKCPKCIYGRTTCPLHIRMLDLIREEEEEENNEWGCYN